METVTLFCQAEQCARCQKKVFAAEEHLAEGKRFHQLCWNLEFKERQMNKKTQRDMISYNVEPDVAPMYFRVGDRLNGHPPRMESRFTSHPVPDTWSY